MKKFLVLYHAPADLMAKTGDKTPEEMQEAMKPWQEWAQKCGDALVSIGNPLGNGQAVSKSGSTPSTKDVAGYSILQAEDMDEAQKLLEGHPHLEWDGSCSIELHEVMPLPGS